MKLSPGQSYLSASVVDPTNGFAYFATGHSYDAESAIVKVRLSDMAPVGVLTFNPGEAPVSAGVIDPVAGFAYFATRSTPGRVVKIRLADFTRVGSLTLSAGQNGLTCGVIDPAGGFAYFGGTTTLGFVARLRLSDFVVDQVLTLDPDERPSAAAVDPAGGFTYFGTDRGNVFKIRLADFTRVGAPLPVFSSSSAAVLDPAAGFAYFAGRTGGASGVVKVRLSDFTVVAALPISPGIPTTTAAAIDPAAGFAYFGSGYRPGIVDKVRLSDLTLVASLTLQSGEDELCTAVIDPAAGYAYFGTSTERGRVVKVSLSDLTRISVIALDVRESSPFAAVVDPVGGFAYFGTYTSPGVVVKIRLSDFQRVATLTLHDGEDNLYPAVIDPAGDYALFGADTHPAKIVKIRLSDFTRVGSLTLEPGENGLASAAVDPAAGFAYFGTYPNWTGFPASAAIVKVRTSDLVRVGALSLGPSAIDTTSAALDPVGGHAYFGTFSHLNTPFLGSSSVVKVRLSDFTLDGVLALDPNRSADALVVDSTGGHLYLGLTGAPGKTARVRIADFARDGDLLLESGDAGIVSGMLDASTDSLFFGTYASAARVIRVRVSTFERIAALAVREGFLGGAGLDPSSHFAYFGADGSPGSIVRVDISSIAAPAATVVGNPAICKGASATVLAYLAGLPPWTLQWSDGLVQTGLVTSPAARSVAPGNTTSYSVVSMSDATSPGTTSGQALVTVLPVPTQPSISAPEWTFASRTGLTASVPAHAGSVYAWSITGGILTSNTALDHVTFNAGTGGVTSLSVSETAAGCASPVAQADIPIFDPSAALRFYPVAPCRLLDTREATGPAAASPALQMGEARQFATAGRCSLPDSAKAISVNVTVTSPAEPGYINFFTAYVTRTSVLNFAAGQTRSGNAIVQRFSDVTRFVGAYNNSPGTVHLILDVNGYFE